MKHSREDYNGRIVDTAGLIPEDEPVFIIRGQDRFAPNVLLFYATCIANENPDIANKVSMHAMEMLMWQNANGRKTPDLPYQKQNTKDDWPTQSTMETVKNLQFRYSPNKTEVSAEIETKVEEKEN